MGRAVESSSELLISIGGVVGQLALEQAPPGLLLSLRRRYPVFLLPGSAPVRPSFAVRLALQPHSWKAGSMTPRARTIAGRIEIERPDFRLTLWPTADATFQGEGRCDAAEFVIDTLLRVLWSVFLGRAGGGLFHSCGFRDGDRGVLAPGQSGAGKTTLARKVADPDHLFSDELVAVHRGERGEWRISGTPFHGALNRGSASPQSYPLGGIAFLEKQNAVLTTPLPLPQAVLRALACLLCFQDDSPTVEQNLALMVDLCSQVPTFTCGTRVDTPFAEVLAVMRPNLAGSLAGNP